MIIHQKGENAVKRYQFLAALLSVCLLLSGCSMIGADVENQLIPPQNDKEQNAMQAALHTYLQNQNFVLTYPTGGAYQTPFVVLNQIQKPTLITTEPTEDSSEDTSLLDGWGVVFYRFQTGNTKTHIHLLKKAKNGSWETVADLEGFGEQIGDVNFADLTGDGFPELLVGWTLYGTEDKRLAIYRLDEQLSSVVCELTYSALLTGSLTSDNAEDIVLIRTNGNDAQVWARLFSLADDRVLFRGETRLDSGIRQITGMTLARISPAVTGMFMDCEKEAGTEITELIYWTDASLESPLSDEGNDLNTVSVRNIPIRSRDIDGDGALEWPALSSKGSYTIWYSYDFRSGEIVEKLTSVVNLKDGYLIRLRPEWVDSDTFTSYYRAEDAVLCFADGTKPPFLELMTVTDDQTVDLPTGYQLFVETDGKRYAVRVAPDRITSEEVQYLFIAL